MTWYSNLQQANWPTEMKRCSKCKQYLSFARFSKNCTTKDGLQKQCKKCSRQHYKNNKQVYIKKATKWARENPERRREISRMSAVKIYQTFKGYTARLVRSAKQRCTNSNVCYYEYYGGRGIKCLFTSQELYDWLITKSIDPRGLDMHRINNDSDYTLDNIEFLTHAEHMHKHARSY